MNLLFLDFESFYSDEFSLRRMSPAEYILSPSFIANGCAFKDGLDGVPYWVDGDQLSDYFSKLDPNILVCSHNFLFDGSILAWRFGFVPRLSCCTMSITQATRRYCLKSVSLSEVARHLKLGFKDGGALTSVKGMDLPAIRAAGLYDSYVEYALHDVELCAGIFRKLVVETHEFPTQELPILDMLMRMTTEPSFVLDRDRLAQHLHNVQLVKQRVLDTLGTDKTLIRQNEVFADMLRAQGVDPPRKVSPTTGLELYAFSKTDEEFLELEQHPNPIVQALCAARLGAKSTIEETRAQRFINISNLQWPVTIRSNSMPMPVRFSGAHTHRGSGDWKLNVQNMTRPSPDGSGGELRKALKAPPGYKVVTVDASQIEARITAFLAGQEDLLEQFENGDDVYSNFASIVYGKPINKKDHPAERFVGKTCILGLGFGMGWMKFHRQINLSKQVVISEEQAVNIVSTYRTTFSNITTLRASLNAAIPVLANGGDVMQLGPVRIEKGMIYMPGRLKMFYHELQHKDGEWVFSFAGKPKRLYGGRVLENIVQYLDRITVFDAAVRIEHRFKALGWGYHLAQQAHDENGYVVKDEHVEQVRAILLEEMTRRPSWGEKLPLMAEVGVGDNYGEAK